jgi:hypothetical protein
LPTSVRLDRETQALLDRIARGAGRSKSWVVREAVAAYAADPANVRAPAELLAPFIGAGGTGLADASERTGEAFAALLYRRSRDRRSR